MKTYLAYILLISSIFSQDGKLAVSILDFTGEDVKNKVFPGKGYSYAIEDEELKALKSSKMWKK